MATMLAVLHPNPSAALLIAALWHDAGERWAGDVPAPAKWAAGYDFNVLLENIELRATGKYNLLAPRELHSEEIQWIHAVDYLEFLLWCYEQKNMGNRNIEPCIRAIEVYFQTHKKEIPEICFNLMVELFEGGWRRLEDKI
jgi:5'-deoxynucleotidase YfbR-like HD superfamily hydrolase